MIAFLQRLLWFAAFGAAVFWFGGHVPGLLDLSTTEDAGRMTVADFVIDVTDPIVLGLALVAVLLVGRWRGTRAALGFLFLPGPRTASATDGESASETQGAQRVSRLRSAGETLAVGARALLWGSCIANAVYLASFWWPQSPFESPGLMNAARFTYVMTGGLLGVALGALVLFPASAEALRRAGSQAKGAQRILHGIDTFALLGLAASGMVFFLGVLTQRAPLIGETGSGFNLLAPTFDGIDWRLVLWSAGLIGLLPWLALAPWRSPSLLARELGQLATNRSGHTLRTFGQLSVAVGVLGTILITIDGVNRISASGGNADRTLLQSLVGRMLVPAALGLAVSLVGRTRLRNQTQSEGIVLSH